MLFAIGMVCFSTCRMKSCHIYSILQPGGAFGFTILKHENHRQELMTSRGLRGLRGQSPRCAQISRGTVTPQAFGWVRSKSKPGEPWEVDIVSSWRFVHFARGSWRYY